MNASWTAADWVTLIGAVGGLITIVGGLLITWRKIEVVRVDVNSSKAALEKQHEGSLGEIVGLRKAEAVRTGQASDTAAADRAVGALAEASRPVVKK